MYEHLNVEKYHYFIDSDKDNQISSNDIILTSNELDKLKEIENVILEIADY